MYKKSMPYQACTVQYICIYIANIELLTLKTDVEIKM